MNVLMIDHAGGQADGRSRRCACQIGCQKGRHIPNFFQRRTPTQQIAAHPALAPSLSAFLKLRVGGNESVMLRRIVFSSWTTSLQGYCFTYLQNSNDSGDDNSLFSGWRIG